MICAEESKKRALRKGFCLSELQEVAKAITRMVCLMISRPEE
jgi:hypothetical protein